MRTWRNTLLASAAALALTAGSGFAQGVQEHGSTGSSAATGAAQEHGSAAGSAQQHGGASAQSPGAASKLGADKADRAAQGTQQSGGSSMEKGAQRNQPGANRNAEENRSANPQNAQNKSDKDKDRAQSKIDRDNDRNAQNKNNQPNKNQAEQNREQNRGTAQEQQRSNERNATTQQRGNNRNAEQQLERSGRLQGNASGVNVQLNDQQRREIRTTVIEKSGAPRVGHVDFDVAVGTVVPRERVHVIPVPETLVRIEPAWRGYMYFVYEDEIIVVNPSDYKIVAVLPV